MNRDEFDEFFEVLRMRYGADIHIMLAIAEPESGMMGFAIAAPCRACFMEEIILQAHEGGVLNHVNHADVAIQVLQNIDESKLKKH
jgi:hypothetical protein